MFRRKLCSDTCQSYCCPLLNNLEHQICFESPKSVERVNELFFLGQYIERIECIQLDKEGNFNIEKSEKVTKEMNNADSILVTVGWEKVGWG